MDSNDMIHTLQRDLARESHRIETSKALLLTDLPDGFVQPEGKLPVCTASELPSNFKNLIAAFRERAYVIWAFPRPRGTHDVNQHETSRGHVTACPTAEARDSDSHVRDDGSDGSPKPSRKARLSKESTERPVTAKYSTQRIGNGSPSLSELEEEQREPLSGDMAKEKHCCTPGSFGAEYVTQIKDLVDQKRDIQVIKTCDSAFESTSLLNTLRSLFIVEVYLIGVYQSVFATATDAGPHGIKVILVEDCLEYQAKDRKELPEAEILSSTKIINALCGDDEDGVPVGEDAEDKQADVLEAGSTDEDASIKQTRPGPTSLATRSIPESFCSRTEVSLSHYTCNSKRSSGI